MEKRAPINISIKVDSYFREQARKWEITSEKFTPKYWHSDTLQRIKDSEDYEMLDSVHLYRYTIKKDIFKKLVENGNVRDYAYVLLPKNIIDMPELNILPPHNPPSMYADVPDKKEVVIAWEVQMSERYASWGKPIYSVYVWDKDTMYNKMDNELAIVRYHQKNS